MMEKIDIIAVFKNIKILLKQAESYSKNGYTNAPNNGIGKIGKFISSSSQQKEETPVLTTNSVPKEVLNAITDQFQKIMGFIQSYYLSSVNVAFYGIFLSGIEFSINYSQKGLIDADPTKDPIVFSYNPFYIEGRSLNDVLGETKTEIEKLVFMHPEAYKKINPTGDLTKHNGLEIGSSVSATELFYSDSRKNGSSNRMTLSDSTITKKDLEDDTQKDFDGGQSLEYYYKMFMAYSKNKNVQLQPNTNRSGSNNSNNNSISTPGNGQGNPIHNWESDKDSEGTKDRIKDLVKSSYDNISNESRGYLPAGLVSQIEVLFEKPQLNWKQILKRFVGTIPFGHRTTSTRLNRRQPERFDLHGTLPDRHIKLVIGIDTSGSMSDNDIAYVINEIYNICRGYKTDITIIECDASIGKIYKPKNKNEVSTKVTGRGGTSFVPVIEYINTHNFKDAIMIYFTDGYGDYEIEKPRTYRNLWVVTGDVSHLSLKEPYGEVKSLDTDKDYQLYCK